MKHIKRIERAIDFGSYNDFTWELGPEGEFRRYNLIYGWNYSGKTTLSRMFSTLQKSGDSGSITGSFSAMIVNKDDSTSTLESRSVDKVYPVRVFNRDFVQANFKSEHDAPAVHIIGEELSELVEKITKENSQIELLNKNIVDLREKIDAQKLSVDEKKTSCARVIDSVLPERYNRINLEKALPEVKFDVESNILSDTQLEACRKTIASAGDYREVVEFQPIDVDLSALVRRTEELMSQSASNRAIAHIRNDNVLEQWLREGLKIHQGKSPCKFCGSDINTDVFNKLNDHFSEEYEQLRSEIGDFIQKLERVNLKVEMPGPHQLLPNFKHDYSLALNRYEIWIEQAHKLIEKLHLNLKMKKANGLDMMVPLQEIAFPVESIQSISNTLLHILREHNDNASDSIKTGRNARYSIESHFIAKLCQEVDLDAHDAEIQSLGEKIIAIEQLSGQCSNRIRKLEEEIKNKSIAAGKLNEILAFLLPGNPVYAYPKGDAYFQFKRNDDLATNLSDGERTAITFAYFLISLEKGEDKLEDMIVFIDDPISSLDSNHIYSVWAIICERIMKCRQLFVSTHNSEFFNLIKDEWCYDRDIKFKRDHQGYWVSRTITGQEYGSSKIEVLPSLLRKFKSEYQFVFSCLHTFAHSKSPTHHEAYTAPNLLRKLLEAYLGFRKPGAGKIHEKLVLLIEDTAKCREIEKFANDASHLQKPARITEYPLYISNAQSICREVMDALKVKDPLHYESLVSLTTE